MVNKIIEIVFWISQIIFFFRYYFSQTPLMSDEYYIIFSRYWTEIFGIGILPLLALVILNNRYVS